MTIKSNGGVFGRNPTYNNTTVDGTLRVADKIVHIGDEDTNLRFPEVNTFSVETNGAERLRVTDAGRLGIGTTTPAGVLHTRSLDPFNLPLRIENTGGSTTFDVRVGSGGTLLQTNGNQFISMAPNAVQSTQFLTNGNVSLLTGNLIIGTSGKGIDFSATDGTGTSELFSDYEEGTWTPVATGITINSGTPVWAGTYTKVGRTVVAQWALSGGSSINVGLSSYLTLPFTAAGNAWGGFGNVSTNTFTGGLVTFGNLLYFGTAGSFSVASGTVTFQV